MANPTIGKIKCPLSGEVAEVRQYSKGTKKLYYVSSFGMITPNSAAGQKWMLDNAELFDSDAPAPAPKPVNEKGEPAPAPKPVNEKPKKKTFLELLLSEDE
jgi:hypothetical protein